MKMNRHHHHRVASSSCARHLFICWRFEPERHCSEWPSLRYDVLLLLFVDSYQHQLSNKRRVGPPSITNYYLVDAADNKWKNERAKLGVRLRECRRLFFSLSRPFTAINARTSGVGGTGWNNGTRRVGDECNITDAIASWWWSSYLHLDDPNNQKRTK